MRNFLWTCTLVLCFVPFVSAQDLEQWRKTIDTNTPAVLPDNLGRKPQPPELVQSCKTVVDAAAQIYALPNLDPKDRQWTLQRETIALIVLVYADPTEYYAKLVSLSDELEQKGLSKLAKEAEKHVLIIGGALATKTGNAPNLNVKSLAERMVMYAEQFPGQDSVSMIDQFLQRIRSMPNAGHRDRRLALAAPIFQEYYKKVNLSKQAFALTADIARATLPGNPLLLMGVDLNGKDLDITAFNDKVVLLQFWGTWCPHCLEEIPDLIALYEKYHAAGLEIIGVNTGVQGDDDKKVKQFIEGKTFNGKKIPWIILHEGLGERKNQLTMTKFYGIDELPVLILVGRNGMVLDLYPLPSTLDERVAQATSLFAKVEFTEEEKKQIEENDKKRQEEEDRKIKLELSKP